MFIPQVIISLPFLLHSIIGVHGKHHKFKRGDVSLGLNPTTLHKNGIAIGFLPAFGEAISPNFPQDINDQLTVPMAIMGDYVKLETGDPNLSLIDRHIPDFKRLEGNPVWEIALMPEEGLEKVTKAVAENIASKMLQLNNKGIIIWLRFAHEMNGDWYKWGVQPKLFIEKWRMVAAAVKSKTKNTYMLWAPNSSFGETLDSVRGGYTKYWPGADTVDISGISYYHYGGYDRHNVLPSPGEAIGKIQEFSKLYGRGQNKPVILSETGASYTTSLETRKPAEGGGSEYDIKFQWIQQLLSPEMHRQIPEFKAFLWFEVIKNENAAGNSPVKQEDFRLLLGKEKLGQQAKNYLENK